MDITNLKAIGSDSTVVNTGYLSGMIHLMEMNLMKLVPWCIC